MALSGISKDFPKAGEQEMKGKVGNEMILRR